MRESASLLIYAPVPLYEKEGILYQEDQACNGLRLWAENFPRLIVLMPLDKGDPPDNWIPIEQVGPALERIEIVPLPAAYRPDKFLLRLPSARRTIRAAIARADYLGFAIGGLFGDWGSVGCVEAYRMGRPYYVWTDRVESEVTRKMIHHGPWRHRLRARLTHRPMAWLERALIRRATLGLFHGRETYDAYSPYCRSPQLVHDIHIKQQDHISAEALHAKMLSVSEGPLRICYVGRADPMKGPLDWVETLIKLAASGIDFQAVWLGTGVEHAEMRRRIAQAGLAGRVDAPGFVAERASIMERLRETHLFVFCHKTPESPRCLIEALASGCPIVGYDNAFAQDLTAAHQGGCFTPLNDVEALSKAIAGLAIDRSRLANLMERAAADGGPFTDVAVFRHRSDLIKTHLG